MPTSTHKIRPIRLHFGVLNDTKVDNLRKLGLLSGPKKNLTTSLRLASVKASLRELLSNLKNSFSPTVKFLQAFVFGLPRKPLYMLSHLLHKLLLIEAFKLQLIIYTPNDFVKKGVAVLGRSLRKLQRLKDLHMELEGRYEVPTNILYSFAHDLSRLQNLNELMLGLKHFRFDPKGLERIFEAIRKLRKLETLRINLSSTLFPTSKKGATYEAEKGIRELADSIRKLGKLKTLDLNLRESDHTQQKNIPYLVDKIGQLEQLEVLSLDLTGCGLMPESIIAIAQTLPRLRNLREFQLTMWSSDGITPQAYEELWKAFGEAQKLEVLEIRTGTATNMYALNNEGIEVLGESLTKLQHLKKLNVTFRGSSVINNVAAVKLGEYIAQLKRLEDVEIHFIQFQKLTDDGLASLKSKLGQVLTLDKIMVRF